VTPKRAGAALLAFLAAMPGLVAAGSLNAQVDGLRLELTSEPDRPGTRRPTTYRLRLSTQQSDPVTDAKVTLHGRMADGMTVLAPLQPGPEPGAYHGRVLFTMEGQWELTLRVSGRTKPIEGRLTEHVGR
jgi:hypothetical protein